MDYKEQEKYLSLLQDKEWVTMISNLRNLKCDYEKNDYQLYYKQKNHKKPQSLYFHKVEYIEDNKTFIFTRYDIDEGEITDKVIDKVVLGITDIMNFEITNKSDYDFVL